MEKESNFRNLVFLNKNGMMDIVQKYNICINVPSSQTFRSYVPIKKGKAIPATGHEGPSQMAVRLSALRADRPLHPPGRFLVLISVRG
jgi:hypothetical protein